MPEYRVQTPGPSGRPMWKSVSASSAAALERDLLAAEICVLQIAPTERTAKSAGRKPSEAQKLGFFEQLETAFQVGMPLLNTLDLCLSALKGGAFRDVLKDLRNEIASGQPFSKALQRHPAAFSPLEVALIAAGDRAGIMPQVLAHLTRALRRASQLKRQISALLVYPKAVGLVLVLVCGVLLGFTLPRFQSMFAAYNVPLPLMTRLLLDASNWLQTHPWLAASLTLGTFLSVRATPQWLAARAELQRPILRLPLAGPLLRQTLTCHFARTFAQLLAARIPALQALQMCRDISQNGLYRESVARATLRLNAGYGLAEALEPMRPVVGTELLSLLAFGEKTGTVPFLLETLSERLEKDLSLRIERLKPVIEVGLTVAIAIVIGGIIIAAILPTFDMVNVLAP